jgi:hypothetical protein
MHVGWSMDVSRRWTRDQLLPHEYRRLGFRRLVPDRLSIIEGGHHNVDPENSMPRQGKTLPEDGIFLHIGSPRNEVAGTKLANVLVSSSYSDLVGLKGISIAKFTCYFAARSGFSRALRSVSLSSNV